MRARLISLSSLVFSFSRSLVLALSLVRARVYSVFSLFLSLPGLLSACLALSVTLFLSLSNLLQRLLGGILLSLSFSLD